MKKQIILLLGLTLGVAAGAKAEEGGPGQSVVIKEVRLSSAFQHLVTYGAVDVVLFEDSTARVSIQGSRKQVEGITIKEKDGVITIDSHHSLKRVVVYLPVNGLETISAYDNSKVSSGTILASKLLRLMVNDYCRIAVRSSGKIIITDNGNTEVEVQKFTQVPMPVNRS